MDKSCLDVVRHWFNDVYEMSVICSRAFNWLIFVDKWTDMYLEVVESVEVHVLGDVFVAALDWQRWH